MKIEHIAVWAKDLEKLRNFYVSYFGMISNDMYHNKNTGFRSYFLSFPGESARIEIMSRNDVNESALKEILGFTHFAISVGSKEKVDELAEIFEKDGFTIASKPRTTGDGYYECAVLDPEGNKVEITV